MSEQFTDWLKSLPDDHFVTIKQFTNSFYRDEYPAINPEDPRLSQKGKVIVITGASSGIGKEGLAVAFARAGAEALFLVARSQSGLETTQKLIQSKYPHVKVVIKSMNVTDEPAVQDLFKQIKSEHGKADVLLNCAGIGTGGALAMAPFENFWQDFEVNFKGTALMSRYFIDQLGGQENGRIINVTSAAGPFVMVGTDSYGLSKLLQLQMQRYIALSNSNVFAASFQPGAILTSITRPGMERFSKDTPALAGGAAVWLASSESDFMNGRYLDATWDVTELVRRKDEIVKEGLLQMELQGDFTKGQKK